MNDFSESMAEQDYNLDSMMFDMDSGVMDNYGLSSFDYDSNFNDFSFDDMPQTSFSNVLNQGASDLYNQESQNLQNQYNQGLPETDINGGMFNEDRYNNEMDQPQGFDIFTGTDTGTQMGTFDIFTGQSNIGGSNDYGYESYGDYTQDYNNGVNSAPTDGPAATEPVALYLKGVKILHEKD